MKKQGVQLLFVVLLLATTAVQAQNKVMRIHSGGNVAYAVNTSQVDSITFQDGTLPESLINTKWKLNGIVDVETGTVTELEPKECRDCYTLSFGTDYTAIAHSIDFLSVLLDLTNLKDYELPKYLVHFPEYYDKKPYKEGSEFCKAVLVAKSCTVAGAELRLYYGDKTNYLRFEPYAKSADDELNDLITSNLSKQGASDSALLIGEWGFVAYAYTEDGIAISNIPSKPKGNLQIKDAEVNSFERQWEFRYENASYYECYLSGGLVELRFRSVTLLPVPDEDEEENEANFSKAFDGVYSYVIKDDKLIIYFTGSSDRNLLIFRKQQDI